MNDPKHTGDHENDAEDELEDGDYGVGICIFEFQVEYFELCGQGVVFWFELGQLAVDFSVRFVFLKASGFFVFGVVLIQLFYIFAFLYQGGDSLHNLVLCFLHLAWFAGFGPMSELVDHVDWQGEEAHSTEDDQEYPSEEWENGDDVHG